MPLALESFVAELCLASDLDDDDALRAALERHGVDRADQTYLLAAARSRLFVYRDLVRGTLWEAMQATIPRTVSRLGEVFEDYFGKFLAERGPRTHYLRDAPRELLEFCAPLWSADPRVPPYAMDLARHEYVQIEVGSERARSAHAEPQPLELDAAVQFIEAVRLMRYDHAVHRLSVSPEDRGVPEASPTSILVYRSPAHEVRYLELTPLAAAILERLLRPNASLRSAILHACEALGQPLAPSVLDGTARLLADLAERGAVLGRAEAPQ